MTGPWSSPGPAPREGHGVYNRSSEVQAAGLSPAVPLFEQAARTVSPSGSVTLGWSSWAVQWLSRTPAPIPDQVQVAYSNDPAARAAYHRQAAEDWRTFLVHRGAELRPGGRLVVLTMALDDHGDFGYRPVVEAMYRAPTGLVEQRFISRNEAERMVIPTVARSRADLLGPFSPHGDLAGLAVEHVEVFLGHDEIWSAFERDRDAAAFGARWAAFNRASVFPTLALGLDGGGDDARAATFFDRMETTVTALLAAAPQPIIMPLATIVLVKTDR